jgi:hypothetical protein
LRAMCYSRAMLGFLSVSFIFLLSATIGNKFIFVTFSLFAYYREKNKRRAEQGAALVCLCAIGVIDIHTLTRNGNIR